MTPAGLLTTYQDLWRDATQHVFLDEVRAGRLPAPAFDQWLVQDYHFVEALVRAQARILARRDLEVLSAGVKATVDELAWFAHTTDARGVTLQTALHPACHAYTTFLHALTYDAYVVQITALWAVERAYLDAWRRARGAEGTYRDFVEHWTSPAFQAYVRGLEDAAHAALERATDLEQQAAASAFRWVAQYEAAFWGIGANK